MQKKDTHFRVLLVDDSINSGKTMNNTIEKILNHDKQIHIDTLALIPIKSAANKVTYYYKTIEEPRIFEWNLMHAKKAKTATDLDGVICENCPPLIDADESKYTDWIKNAKPHFIPNFEIDAIITCRLSKYRDETINWLKKHDVKYKEIYFWGIRSKVDRKGGHAQYKIASLFKVMPDIFWESS